MSFKTFYTNLERKKFFEQKALTKFSYPKQLVRSSFSENEEIYVIDNYIGITNIITKKKLTLGMSFYSKSIIFTHKYNKTLKINSFVSFSNTKKKCVALKFYNTLNFLYYSDESLGFMLFLNPIKGGFLAYGLGIIAFVPKSQCSFSFKHLLILYLKNKEKQQFLSNSTFLLTNNIASSFFSVRVPFKLRKFKVSPQRAWKKNFSRFSKKKKLFKNYFNFVFIYKFSCILKENIHIKSYAK